MTAIAAIVSFDGQPVAPRHIATLLRPGARHGSTIETWSRDVAGMGRVHWPTTIFDPPGQPVIHASGAALVFSGRLDNRSELLAELALAPSAPDAEIAAAALAKWDAAAPVHLLGDFAFAWWDAARRRALLARDHFGVRTLYFHLAPWGLVCASELAQVLADSRVPRSPDLEVVAGYLGQDSSNGAATLFAGVQRVPPGHVAIVSAGSLTLSPYWTLEPRTGIRYASDGEYAEHCRSLLLESVRVRSRSNHPVATTLSGGIDSSAVTVAARVASDNPLRAFSLIFPGHPETDERHFIEVVGAGGDQAPVLLQAGKPSAEVFEGWASRWLDLPATAVDAAAIPLWREIAGSGARVALTGVAGDLVFGGSAFHSADLVRAMKFRTAAGRWSERRGAVGGKAATIEMIRTGLWPLLPSAARRMSRPLARKTLNAMTGAPARAWLLLPPALRAAAGAPRGGSFANEQFIRELTSGAHSYFVEMAGRVARDEGVELRHPLLDTRLVQFAIDIPEDQRQRGSLDRFVLRGAVARELPVEIAGRTTKADFAHVVRDAIEALGGTDFYGNLSTARAGWISGPGAAGLYRQMADAYPAGHDAYGQYVPALWWIAALEQWYRAAFGHTAAAV